MTKNDERDLRCQLLREGDSKLSTFKDMSAADWLEMKGQEWP